MAGNNLFNARIAEKINAALGSLLLEGTLRKITYSAFNPADPTASPTQTVVTHTFKGIFDLYDQRRFGDTAIKTGERIVLLLGESLPHGVLPEVDDEIVLEGDTVKIVGPIVRDPDKASYACKITP